jgi:alanine racemase
MNLTMIDLTEVPKKPKAGDRVVILGTDKKESITADMLAALASTIHYEIVDRINPQLPRIVI